MVYHVLTALQVAQQLKIVQNGRRQRSNFGWEDSQRRNGRPLQILTWKIIIEEHGRLLVLMGLQKSCMQLRLNNSNSDVLVCYIHICVYMMLSVSTILYIRFLGHIHLLVASLSPINLSPVQLYNQLLVTILLCFYESSFITFHI